MQLLIKKIDTDGRFSLIFELLSKDWTVAIVDDEDAGAYAAALRESDAHISFVWQQALAAPKLKLLQTPGAGLDRIDFDALPPQTYVCNAFGHEVSIAEYTLGAMLELTIQLRKMDASMRANDWWGCYLCGPRHGHLYGKTLGIVGYGRIGRETARRAHAFGMRVIACNRSAKPADEFVERAAAMSELDQLLRESDYVLIGTPLDESTRDLIDARALNLMKPNAIIINPSRGPVINEEALYQALRDHRIGGAAIDTWYNYPEQGEREAVPSRFAFHELDNILMTPHASGWTEHLKLERSKQMVENLNRLARGEALTNVVRTPLTVSSS